MLKISQLFVYPIKSLGGIALDSASVTERGLEFDRRWMLVDSQNRFMTQREFPHMALLQVNITTGGLQVQHKLNSSKMDIPFEPAGPIIEVQVWDDTCQAVAVSSLADGWFSDMLSMICRLVFMPGETKRKVDRNFARNDEITSFSDAFPFLIIGQSSLDDLNSRMETRLPVNRFRPNIVFTGGLPFEEDQLSEFEINGIRFYGVKPCGRCAVTTVDQETASKGKEPLQTLSTYRNKNGKVYFGQNLLHKGNGLIQVGDELIIIKKSEAPFISLAC